MENFQKGDSVLVRKTGDEWYFATYWGYDAPIYKVILHGCEHWGLQAADECVPYNEETFKLLGTKDNYKK